jgi:hypothetical protein
MERKTKIILISVFILVGIIILGFYLYNKNKKAVTSGQPSLYQQFNPFGVNKTVTQSTGDVTGTTEQGPKNSDITTATTRLHKLTDFSVAGAAFFEESKLDTAGNPTIVPSLRYTERATGHIYQMNLDLKTSGKISNSTIPGVYETIFNNDTSSLIYRYASSDNKSITSFLATIGGKSNFLSPDILEVALSPDKSKFFSIIKNLSGVSGSIKNFTDVDSKQVFTSSFSEWLPQWVTEQYIYLTTKPSYLVDGSIFSLNTTTGTLSKIFGEVKGLTTLVNKDGSLILYGASLDTGPRLNILNVKKHTSLDLNKYGLPEKCIWSNDNINVYCAVPNTIMGMQYPDIWYQGLVSFDDFFIKINTKTSESITIANSKDEIPVDAINLFFNKDESKLFFTNKKDYTLWSLDL